MEMAPGPRWQLALLRPLLLQQILDVVVDEAPLVLREPGAHPMVASTAGHVAKLGNFITKYQ